MKKFNTTEQAAKRQLHPRKPIKYWTANIMGSRLHEIDRHESKAILTARHGHYNIVYKAIR